MQKYPKAEVILGFSCTKEKICFASDVTLPLMCCNKTTFLFLFKAFQLFDLRY